MKVVVLAGGGPRYTRKGRGGAKLKLLHEGVWQRQSRGDGITVPGDQADRVRDQSQLSGWSSYSLLLLFIKIRNRNQEAHNRKEKELILCTVSLVCLCGVHTEMSSRLINRALLKFKTEVVLDKWSWDSSVCKWL